MAQFIKLFICSILISASRALPSEILECTNNLKNVPKFNISRFATGRWYVYKAHSIYEELTCAYGDFSDKNYTKFSGKFKSNGENQEQTIKYSSTQVLALII